MSVFILVLKYDQQIAWRMRRACMFVLTALWASGCSRRDVDSLEERSIIYPTRRCLSNACSCVTCSVLSRRHVIHSWAASLCLPLFLSHSFSHYCWLTADLCDIVSACNSFVFFLWDKLHPTRVINWFHWSRVIIYIPTLCISEDLIKKRLANQELVFSCIVAPVCWCLIIQQMKWFSCYYLCAMTACTSNLIEPFSVWTCANVSISSCVTVGNWLKM